MTDRTSNPTTYALECFEAALAEGWIDALVNGDIERIRDLWTRRISFAHDALRSPPETRAEPSRADRVRAAFAPGYKTGCYEEHCAQPAYDVGLERCPSCGAPNLNFERYAPESSEKSEAPQSDKCEHGLPRRFCTAVHEGDPQ